MLAAAAEAGVSVFDEPICSCGRIEWSAGCGKGGDVKPAPVRQYRLLPLVVAADGPVPAMLSAHCVHESAPGAATFLVRSGPQINLRWST